MSGIDIFFDINNKIKFVLIIIIVLSGIGIVVSVVLKCLLFLVLLVNVFIVISVFGSIVILVVVVLDYWEDFDMFCLKFFLVWKDVFLKMEIRVYFYKMYVK